MSYSNYQLNQKINNLQQQINNIPPPSGDQNLQEVMNISPNLQGSPPNYNNVIQYNGVNPVWANATPPLQDVLAKGNTAAGVVGQITFSGSFPSNDLCLIKSDNVLLNNYMYPESLSLSRTDMIISDTSQQNIINNKGLQISKTGEDTTIDLFNDGTTAKLNISDASQFTQIDSQNVFVSDLNSEVYSKIRNDGLTVSDSSVLPNLETKYTADSITTTNNFSITSPLLTLGNTKADLTTDSTAITQLLNDSSTKISTTQFVQNQIGAIPAPPAPNLQNVLTAGHTAIGTNAIIELLDSTTPTSVNTITSSTIQIDDNTTSGRNYQSSSGMILDTNVSSGVLGFISSLNPSNLGFSDKATTTTSNLSKDNLFLTNSNKQNTVSSSSVFLNNTSIVEQASLNSNKLRLLTSLITNDITSDKMSIIKPSTSSITEYGTDGVSLSGLLGAESRSASFNLNNGFTTTNNTSKASGTLNESFVSLDSNITSGALGNKTTLNASSLTCVNKALPSTTTSLSSTALNLGITGTTLTVSPTGLSSTNIINLNSSSQIDTNCPIRLLAIPPASGSRTTISNGQAVFQNVSASLQNTISSTSSAITNGTKTITMTVDGISSTGPMSLGTASINLTTASTAVTQSYPNNTSAIATTQYVTTAINNIPISATPSLQSVINVSDDLQGITPTTEQFIKYNGTNVIWSDLPTIPDGSITTAKLADSSVTTAKIADSSVNVLKLGNNSVSTSKIINGDVTTAKLADDSVTSVKLGNGSVITSKIVDANVTNAKLDKANIPLSGFGAPIAEVSLGSQKITNLANPTLPQDAVTKAYVDAITIPDGSITTAKLADGSVTTLKLADLNVTTLKLADLSVTTSKLADLNVTTAKLADSNVTTAKIADANVTNAKLDKANISLSGFGVPSGPISFGSQKITNLANPTLSQDGATKSYVDNFIPTIPDGSITTAKLADLNVTTIKLADNSITTAKIANANVTNAKLDKANISLSGFGDPTASISLGSQKITNLANPTLPQDAVTKAYVDAITIPDGSITTAKLADSSVTTSKLADLNVTTIKLADSNITTAKIADLNVTTAKLADSSVSTNKIIDASVTTQKLADSSVNIFKLSNNSVSTSKIIDGDVTSAKIADGSVTNAKLNKPAIPLSGFGDPIASISLGSQKITNLANPTLAQDGATKAYVDSSISLSATLTAGNTANNSIVLSDETITTTYTKNSIVGNDNLTISSAPTKLLKIGSSSATENVEIATQEGRSVVLHLGDGDNAIAGSGVHINNGLNSVGNTQINNSSGQTGTINIGNATSGTTTTNIRGNSNIEGVVNINGVGSTNTSLITIGNATATGITTLASPNTNITRINCANIQSTTNTTTMNIGTTMSGGTTINIGPSGTGGATVQMNGLLNLNNTATNSINIGNTTGGTTAIKSNTINIQTDAPSDNSKVLTIGGTSGAFNSNTALNGITTISKPTISQPITMGYTSILPAIGLAGLNQIGGKQFYRNNGNGNGFFTTTGTTKQVYAFINSIPTGRYLVSSVLSLNNNIVSTTVDMRSVYNNNTVPSFPQPLTLNQSLTLTDYPGGNNLEASTFRPNNTTRNTLQETVVIDITASTGNQIGITLLFGTATIGGLDQFSLFLTLTITRIS
jgi:hypothetical protein